MGMKKCSTSLATKSSITNTSNSADNVSLSITTSCADIHNNSKVENMNEIQRNCSPFGMSASASSSQVPRDLTVPTHPQMSLIMDWKAEGNKAYEAKDYASSLVAYDKAITLMDDVRTVSDITRTLHQQEQDLQKQIPSSQQNVGQPDSAVLLLANLLSNRAMVSIKLGKYSEAELDCCTILQHLNVLDQPKVWYRRAVAREGMAMSVLTNINRINNNKTSNNPTDSNTFDRKERETKRLVSEDVSSSSSRRSTLAEALLLQAKSDLQECLKVVDMNTNAKSSTTCASYTYEITRTNQNDKELKETVLKMAIRLQKSLSQTKGVTSATIQTPESKGVHQSAITKKMTTNKVAKATTTNLNISKKAIDTTTKESSSKVAAKKPTASSIRNSSHNCDTKASGEGTKEAMRSSSSTTPTNIAIQPRRTKPPPSREQQRHDVLQLLIARKVSIARYYRQQHQESTTSTTTPIQIVQESMNESDHLPVYGTVHSDNVKNTGICHDDATIEGEAFFLLDWKWWCQWTHYTNFFGSSVDFFDVSVSNKGDSKEQPNRVESQQKQLSTKQEQILRYLPPGAILPNLRKGSSHRDTTKDTENYARNRRRHLTTTNETTDNSNEIERKVPQSSLTTSSSSSTTSSSSSTTDIIHDEDDWSDNHLPGPIDNSSLLLPPLVPRSQFTRDNDHTESISKRTFFHHWFKPYHQNRCHQMTSDGANAPSNPVNLLHDNVSKIDTMSRNQTDASTDATTANNNDISNKTTVLSTPNKTAIISSLQPPPIRPNLVRGYHYEIVPREVYNAFRTWYGEITQPICRRTTKTASGKELELVLYPFLYHRTTNDDNIGSTEATSLVNTLPSSSQQQQQLTCMLKRLCNACRTPQATMRCQRCMSVKYCDRFCQESHWPFHKLACKEIAASVVSVTYCIDNDNDSSIKSLTYENSDAITKQQNQLCERLHHQQHGIGVSKGDNLSPSFYNNLGWSVEDGRVGLNNLGNTCFMNSAIQCLSHATPLTRHFLSGLFKSDINYTNPLGTGGKLAQAYAVVLKDIWWSKNSYTSTSLYTMNIKNNSKSPTELKRAIASFAPRFAGYMQHDAQEFLAYLLDGLHEDMNRIIQAPYIPMPDTSTCTNMNIAGARTWDAHKRRNDSIVLDTFYGQFKSTCVCPICHKVSVSFDSFNHVSLEIPQPTPYLPTTLLSDLTKATDEIVPCPVYVFRKPPKPNCRPPIPVRYGVPYNRHSTTYHISDFRQDLSNMCQIPVQNLVLCKIYQHKVTNIYHDSVRTPFADLIRMNDLIVAYELDHNFNNPNKLLFVVNHLFIDPVAAKQTGRAPQDREPKPDSFGYPFLTSIPNHYTCRQVWDHIWGRVGHLVNPVPSTPHFDNRTLLQIRVVDGHGDGLDLFPKRVIRSRQSSLDMKGNDNNNESISIHDNRNELDASKHNYYQQLAQEMTSILPSDSNAVLKEMLDSSEAGGELQFLSLEWNDPTDETVHQQQQQQQQPSDYCNKENEIVYRIDEERFTAFEDHVSWMEALKKLKAAAIDRKLHQQQQLLQQHHQQQQRMVTLHECLEKFTKPERLDEHNMWYCSICKDHVRAMKTMQLWRLPNILVIHLKRFEFKPNNGFRREKLDILVDFPLDGLDLNQYCHSSTSSSFVNEQIPAVYDCFAVTNHFGAMGYGHYTAIARKWNEVSNNCDIVGRAIPNDWALFDDSIVRPLTGDVTESIVTPAAYVLFYRRRIFS